MIQDDDAAVVGKGGKAVISIEKEPWIVVLFPLSFHAVLHSVSLFLILAGD